MAQATQRQTVTMPDGYLPGHMVIDRFDPALGTLTGVTVSLTVSVDGSVSVENRDAAPVAVKAAMPVTLYLYGPASFLFDVQAKSGATATLAAFDGAADFAGASGTVLSGLGGSQTTTVAYAAGDPLAGAFVGTGEVTLSATYTAALDAEVGGAVRLLSKLGAVSGEVAVTYDYTPAGGDGSSGVVVTNVTGTTLTFEALGAVQQTVTTARQVRSVPAAPTGTTQVVAVDRFDPALGTLLGVKLRLEAEDTTIVGLENLGQRWGQLSVVAGVAMEATVAGVAAPLATARVNGLFTTRYVNEADGTADFLGEGGAMVSGTTSGASLATVSDPAALAAFSGSGTVELSLHGRGVSTVAGLPDVLVDLTNQASARVEVSYVYAPGPEVTPIGVANGSKGTQETPTPAAYGGPVPGIVNEFAQITTDNLAISAATDSWYIRTGSGMDAIRVSNGTNVLDGGAGSNFLMGGDGADTFFVDALWVTAPLWNTISGMGAGDGVTIWGLTSSVFSLAWRNGLGADGNTGLTLLARAPNVPTVATTFAGWTLDDLNAGRLVTSFGTADDLPYMHIHAV